MTAVLIPSSPPKEEPNTAPRIVQEIAAKIQNGTEKVTKRDLQQLRLILASESVRKMLDSL